MGQNGTGSVVEYTRYEDMGDVSNENLGRLLTAASMSDPIDLEAQLCTNDRITVKLPSFGWRTGSIVNIEIDEGRRIFTIQYDAFERPLRDFLDIDWKPAANSPLAKKWTGCFKYRKPSRGEMTRQSMRPRKTIQRYEAGPASIGTRKIKKKKNLSTEVVWMLRDRSNDIPIDAVKFDTPVLAYCDIEQRWIRSKVIDYYKDEAGEQLFKVHFISYPKRHDKWLPWGTHMKPLDTPTQVALAQPVLEHGHRTSEEREVEEVVAVDVISDHGDDDNDEGAAPDAIQPEEAMQSEEVMQPEQGRQTPTASELTVETLSSSAVSIAPSSVEMKQTIYDRAEYMIKHGEFSASTIASQMRREATKRGVTITWQDFMSYLCTSTKNYDQSLLEAIQDMLDL